MSCSVNISWLSQIPPVRQHTVFCVACGHYLFPDSTQDPFRHRQRNNIPVFGQVLINNFLFPEVAVRCIVEQEEWLRYACHHGSCSWWYSWRTHFTHAHLIGCTSLLPNNSWKTKPSARACWLMTTHLVLCGWIRSLFTLNLCCWDSNAVGSEQQACGVPAAWSDAQGRKATHWHRAGIGGLLSGHWALLGALQHYGHSLLLWWCVTGCVLPGHAWGVPGLAMKWLSLLCSGLLSWLQILQGR